MLRRSLIGLHTLLAARDAGFLSLQDPPAWARAHATACANRHAYPVLVGEEGDRDLVLCSPIILSDYPQVAPESTGPSFDGTEIDELLALAVASLTEDEKRDARATDPRAAELIDRVDAMPPEMLDRLHGAIRQLGSRQQERVEEPAVAEELAAFLGVDEAPMERLVVGDAEIALGARVRLRPNRRADAQDLFVEGRLARVERIVGDVDGETYVAVTLEDDPGADLHEWYGRFWYFHPDEIELVEQRR